MSGVWAVCRRELAGFFDTIVGPVVVGISLLLFGAGVFYFSDLLGRGLADLQPLFFWTPLVLALTAPAVTMRLVAEERRSGTFELLRSLPLTAGEVVTGKFLAGTAVLALAILGTLPHAVTVALLGPLDPGPVVAGYLGMLLMAATLVAAGLLVSTLTASQTVAFFVTELITVLWWASGRLATAVPPWLAQALEFVSIDSRFRAIARGVIDSRDVLALVAMAAICLVLAAAVLRHGRLRS